MQRAILISLLCFASSAFSGPLQDDAAVASLPNASFHGANQVASGRLVAADIPKLAAAGVKEIIDLSDDAETPDFDEAAAVAAAGMSYRNLPIRGAADLNAQNVRRFDSLLDAAGDKPTLVHCASSNRVGALMALRAGQLQDKSADEALEIGKAWGLKSLEPTVRDLLADGVSDHQAGGNAK